MNKRFWCGAIVAGLATAAITGQVLSQDYDDKKPGAGHGEMDMEAVMKEWMALSQPGKMHKFLQGMAGTWDAKAKMWMGGPGTPATESTGRQITKSVLGGRFILDTYVGEFKMPGPGGEMQSMPFEGIGITGYDNFRNMFVATWADNMWRTQIRAPFVSPTSEEMGHPCQRGATHIGDGPSHELPSAGQGTGQRIGRASSP